MRMLLPNPKTLSKNIENISKSGVNIDDFVRSSIRRDIKSIIESNDTVADMATQLTAKSRLPLKETLFTSVASPPSSKNKPICRNKNKIASKSRSLSEKDGLYFSKFHFKISNSYSSNNLKRKKENLVNKEQFDDSLASLHWLTDINVDDILEGKLINPSPSPSQKTSLLSYHGIDKNYRRGDERYSRSDSVNYQSNNQVKPPYSYAALIVMAMKSKVNGKMTLSEIYKWISDNFLFYRNAEPSWQNSIRHNLSLNKCFSKIPRKKGEPGKGGYWSIVPEFADRLLENSIRKRRCNIVEYGVSDVTKRPCIGLLKTTQLISKMKVEIKDELVEHEKSFDEPIVDQIVPTDYTPHSPVEILADTEQCRMDHPYGKSPVVNYNISDEESIRAIATHLEETTNPDLCSEVSCNDITSSNSTFTALSNAIRTDCIWSSEQHDSLSESMSKVTAELLEARNIGGSEIFLKKAMENSHLATVGLASSLPDYMDLDE